MKGMLSVEEARQRIMGAFAPLPTERVGLSEALGRALAADVVSRTTQPPSDVSAMDGYAVRAVDVAAPPATLRQIGAVPAGSAFDGRVGPGETVRIFTGGVVPEGADAIVIQEDTEAEGERVTMKAAAPEGHYIRPAGLDFRRGDLGLPAGRKLSPRDIGLAAAMNVPWLEVRRRPRIAVLSTGDELVLPGDALGPNQIVSSNGPALKAFVEAHGGDGLNLGIVRDDPEAIERVADAARGLDLLVTSGGASVGEHDLVQSALGRRGLTLDFWKIAMRPGKPLMFGHLDDTPFLGLPGNPVSSLVCAVLFIGPIIDTLLGLERSQTMAATALLGCDLRENDRRQDYLRATLTRSTDGSWVATPFDRQDSSMLSALVKADCLVVRPPRAPAAKAGDRVEIVLLPRAVAEV